MKKINGLKFNGTLLPVENEVEHLLDMFEFYLTERQLGKPIATLGEAVKDLRLIIGRILIDHFMGLKEDEQDKFSHLLTSMLADRAATLPFEPEGDGDYSKYCMGEIITVFEYAKEIKNSFSNDSIMQKILALDIPILRPFDYGLAGKFKCI